jgi:CHAT domain-containing protein
VTTVLVVGPQGRTALQLPAGFSTLNPLINELRLAIRGHKAYRAQAQALYRHLVAPVEAHLRTQKLEPKTLMLYLTGRLRYLPFATLVDDKGHHLIEKYRLAVFTAAARGKADADPTLHWSVTAFGSTKPKPSANLTALPAVQDELDGIVRTAINPKGTLPGQLFIDDKFTREAWQKMLDGEPGVGNARSSVVHVATHFQSRPGNWNNSFLLLGSGVTYTISELDDTESKNLHDVDLITLSACATELTDSADGKEFEGLGAMFQQKGAKAVIGTLWPVQDEGSAALMRAFYAARGEQRQMSKAQALQSAQIQLITGKIKSRNPSVDLADPYYWAPFILMGNWL